MCVYICMKGEDGENERKERQADKATHDDK